MISKGFPRRPKLDDDHIPLSVPDGKSGEWEVSTMIISEDDARWANLRASISFSQAGQFVEPGVFKKLTRNGTMVMSNTLSEVRDHHSFLYQVKSLHYERILINGLGLGMVLVPLLRLRYIRSITVIEISKDVIKLVSPSYRDKRLQIIRGDAFKYKPEKRVKFDAVWHDIWDNKCDENLPEMNSLIRKYSRIASWQGCWGELECRRIARGGYR
jgi:hypothetical protein